MAGRGNIDVLERMDTELLEERQENSGTHCIETLVLGIPIKGSWRDTPEAWDQWVLDVEQAAAGAVFVFEVECQLAARRS